MKMILFKKFIIGILIVSFIVPFLGEPKTANALDVDIDGPWGVPDAIANAGHFMSFGTPIEGTVQGTATGAGSLACDQGTAALEQGTGFLNSISGGFALIGGSAAESAKLGAMVAALQSRVICFQALVDALEIASAKDVTYRQQFDTQQKLIQLKAQKEQAQQRLNDVQALLNASTKDFLRAIMTRIILNLSKAYTTKFVNSLVQRYRIPKILAYADVLGTQVYAMDYIKKNYAGDAQQQMILRSLLQAQYLNAPGRLQTARTLIQARAEKNLGIDPSRIPLDDLTFERSMARVAGMNNNWMTLELINAARADTARSAGMSAAYSEVASSNGFMSSRTSPGGSCASALGQQKNIDLQTSTVSRDYESANDVYQKLVDNNANKSEIDKAFAAREQSYNQLMALPDKVGKPIVDACNIISSPANFIARSTGDYLKSYLEQNTNLKTDNLPFFANVLADMASNLIQNILPGGNGNAKNTLLDESLGLVGEGINEVTRIIPSAQAENPQFNKNYLINFDISPTHAKPGENFVISVDLTGLKESDGPFRIEVTAPSGRVDIQDTVNKPEKVEYDATLPSDATPGKILLYNIVVKGAGFAKAQQLQIDIDGTVAGAFTSKFSSVKSWENTKSIRLR